MLFNSLGFLFYFPIVTTLYFLLPHKYRWFMLLSASCFFYMVFIPAYILILLVTISIDYIAAIYIEKSEDKRQRKTILIISIISTCAVLFIFKYANFINSNFVVIAHFFHLNYPISILHIILPIGLSFHTFQSLSYVIEVYRGKQKAEHNFGIYALYVMFYPQLVAGPIERPQNLLHQFYEKHEFEYRRVTDGLKSMAWGLFKKMVIADRLAVLVNQVYNDPSKYQGIPLIMATIFFSIQIYCDFSGYSDIAIGAAQVMGFKLMDNFKRPYFSKSVSEFWKRWHISLSTWFRDYIYIPLGGNRVATGRLYFNLFITFLICGVWHGANWTYIIWGALHGFFLIISIVTKNIRILIKEKMQIARLPRFEKAIQISLTFGLVSFAWILFRANSLSEVRYIITHLFADIGNVRGIHDIAIQFRGIGLQIEDMIYSIFFISVMVIFDILGERESVWSRIKTKPLWFRWATYYALAFSLLFYSQTDKVQNFIYFQF